MAKRLLIIWALVAGAVGGAEAQTIDASGPGAPNSVKPLQVAQISGSQSAPGQNPQAAQSAPAQTSPAQASSAQPPAPQVPPARLIKRRTDLKPADRSHPRPLDERCRSPKDQLEAVLQKPGNAHRLFQARLAYNAGNRLCRDGHAERGMAEFQRGLSYLEENSHP